MAFSKIKQQIPLIKQKIPVEKFKLTRSDISKGLLGSIAVVTDGASEVWAKADIIRNLNKYTSALSKAMDKKFLTEGISKEMFPSNHRIMDGGHGLYASLEKAREIGAEEGWSSVETFRQWATSYFTDLSSPAGMPALEGLTKPVYSSLRDLGMTESTARDLVTVNGQEAINALLCGSIAAAGFVFCWKKKDKDSFSRLLGSIVSVGAVTMNPAAFVVAIVALAFGYNTLVCKEAVARGAILSSATMAVSVLIPGPLLLGLVPALIVSIYLSKKMGTEFKPIEFTKNIILLISSGEFKKSCVEMFRELRGKVPGVPHTPAHADV